MSDMHLAEWLALYSFAGMIYGYFRFHAGVTDGYLDWLKFWFFPRRYYQDESVKINISGSHEAMGYFIGSAIFWLMHLAICLVGIVVYAPLVLIKKANRRKYQYHRK